MKIYIVEEERYRNSLPSVWRASKNVDGRKNDLINNKYSENAKSCKALVIMYIDKFILFTFS